MNFRNFICLVFMLLLASCNWPRYNFDKGIIPLEIRNFTEVNSSYDDYNSDIVISSSFSSFSLMFSTNRYSAGANFDYAYYNCDLESNLINNDFNIWAREGTISLLDTINTAANEFGPYITYDRNVYNPNLDYDSIRNTQHRLLYSSDEKGNLDIRYIYYKTDDYSFEVVDNSRNLTLLNSDFDDGYLCLHKDVEPGREIVYFTSNRDGEFNIYSAVSEENKQIEKSESLEISMSPILSSDGDDKCPYIIKNMMVFTSNRAGGFGAYDLYYSIYDGQEWSSPENFGEEINTEYDEFRPIILDLNDESFLNDFLIFSSNRPGGMGGFDLYYSGLKPLASY